jgi:hypothetical protein
MGAPCRRAVGHHCPGERTLASGREGPRPPAAIAFTVGIPVLMVTCQLIGVVDFSHPVDKAYLVLRELGVHTFDERDRDDWLRDGTGWSATAAHSSTTSVGAVAVGISVAAGQFDGVITCPMRAAKEDGR